MVQQEKAQSRLPYSTPSLVRYGLSGLMQNIRRGGAQNAGTVEKTPICCAQLPLITVEGFDGDVRDAVEVLSFIKWRSEADSQTEANSLESPRQDPGAPMILLIDARRHNSGSRQTLTQIETDSPSSCTLAIVLTDPGEDFRTFGAARRPDRWHFAGSITSEGLGVLIPSVFRIGRASRQTPSKLSVTPQTRTSESPTVVGAEGD